MFQSFFHLLRAYGLAVSLTEWLTLMEALSKGLHKDSLDEFYILSRSLLVKDLSDYDAFDQAFAAAFKGATPDFPELDDVLAWLESSVAPLRLSPEELAKLKRLSPEELMGALEEILRKQEGIHNGGHHWIGTGGTSPYGKLGSHPTGISFDPEGGGGQGVMRAVERNYQNFRKDRTLDVRQMTVALKRLRALRRQGEEILDLDETIDKTCREGGEIELVFGRERENQVRLILAMDSGGSMEPYRELCERLFSAANSINHFKEFHPFYFHNSIYENLYTDIEKYDYTTVDDLVRNQSGDHYRLVIVGDAAMAPFELLIPNGYLERRRNTNVKSLDRLRTLAERYPKRVWLNPLPESEWGYHSTVSTIRGLFPMFPLSIEGLENAVRELV